MVLSDNEIWKEINSRKKRKIIFDPPLEAQQVRVSSIDLRVSDRFVTLKFSDERTTPGVQTRTDVILGEFLGYEELERVYGQETIVPRDGVYRLEPRKSVLAWTHERIVMPPHLAGRIEGKSTLARLGLTIHNTAPTIHPGFGYTRDGRPVGKSICLELRNSNEDITIVIRPKEISSSISQLILERVTSAPGSLYFEKGQFVAT